MVINSNDTAFKNLTIGAVTLGSSLSTTYSSKYSVDDSFISYGILTIAPNGTGPTGWLQLINGTEYVIAEGLPSTVNIEFDAGFGLNTQVTVMEDTNF